jgi:hypothetical protein
MKIVFTVHRVQPVKVNATAVVKGQTVSAQVDGLEVELTGSLDGAHTSSLSFQVSSPAEIQEIKAKFVPGSTLTWTI